MSLERYVARFPSNFKAMVLFCLVLTLAGPGRGVLAQAGSPPQADAGFDVTAPIGSTVILDASGSVDADGDGLTFQWTLSSAPAGSAALTALNNGLSDISAVRVSFSPDIAGSYVFEVTVRDGGVATASDEVTISTIGSLPVADAGLDRSVSVGDTVFVDTTGSFDFDGDPIDVVDLKLISKPAGSAAYLGSGTHKGFTVDKPGDYVAELTLAGGVDCKKVDDVEEDDDDRDDRICDSTDDGVLVLVKDTVAFSTVNVAPFAHAGAEQSVSLGDRVTLSGAGSHDADGDALSFQWSLLSAPSESAAALEEASSITPEFVVDIAGDYVAQLAVTDTQGATSFDTVVVTTNNGRPVADAGDDQRVAIGVATALDGSASTDPDGAALAFKWSVLNKFRSTIVTGTDTSAPSVTPQSKGLRVIQLFVSDGVLYSEPDHVVIATNKDYKPTAKIAAADGETGIAIALDGAGSLDLNGNGLTAQWSIIAHPASSTATIANPTALTTEFIADVRGEYLVQLVVGDALKSKFVSDPATFLIFAETRAPIADAGANQSVFVGNLAQLDGSASSDPDGDAITYQWAFTSKPTLSSVVLSDSTLATPTFTPDVRGDYVLQLVVNDGFRDSEPAFVTVTAPNRPPVANAGLEQMVALSDVVMLDGTASTDPDGDALTYQWSFLEVPLGSVAVISDPGAPSPTFTPDVSGGYLINLIVSDGLASSSPALVLIEAVGGNQSPVLAAIGNKTITLGETLTIPLQATDADGDLLTYFASPLPLPAGASFNAVTGVFTYRPTLPEQVGDISFTFSVTDRVETVAETITVSVLPTGNGPTTYSGRIIDAIDAENGVITPVSGALVMIGEQSGLTGADGKFSITDAPVGEQIIWVMPQSTPPAPDGSAYAGTQVTLFIVENADNMHDSDILMPRITGSYVDHVAGMPLVIEDVANGIRVEAPADAAFLLKDPPLARYWRVRFIRSAIFGPSLTEIEFRAEVGGPNMAVGGTISASSLRFNTPTYRVENLLDGSTRTFWSGGRAPLQWVAYDFGSGNEIAVQEFILQGGFRFGQPHDFEIQFSNNGVDWTTFQQYFDVLQWGSYQARAFQLTPQYFPADEPLAIAAVDPNTVNVLPPNVVPCRLFSIEPKSVEFQKPIKVIAQNVDGLPPGAPVDLWLFSDQGFSTAGRGNVSADGATLEAFANGVRGGDLMAFAPARSNSSLAAGEPTTTYVPSLMNEGAFATSISVPGYYSNGQNRSLEFVYNSNAAAPLPIIEANAVTNSATPNEVGVGIEIGGATLAENAGASTQAGVNGAGALGNGAAIRLAGQIDGAGFATGVYDYEFSTKSKYSCSAVTNSHKGRVFIDNQTDSSFGRGWSLAELSRLYPAQNGGAVLIRDGDGTLKRFAGQTDFSTLGEPTMLPVDGPVDGLAIDFDEDGDNDFIWYEYERGGLVFFENDGVGGFTEMQFIKIGFVGDVPPAGTFVPDITDIDVGDFDGDGLKDLVVSSQRSDRLWVLYQMPRGEGFGSPVSITGRDYRAMAAGDFNGDGIDDIVGFRSLLFGIFITGEYYTGSRSRAFTTTRMPLFTGGDGALDAIAKDLNDDGIEDILLRYTGGVVHYRGRSTDAPRFHSVVNISTPNFLNHYLEVGEFTGDNLLDFVVGSRVDDLRVFRQTSGGAFSQSEILTTGTTYGELTIGDLNGDGRDDLITGYGTNIATWFGELNGGFSAPEIVDTGFGLGSPVLADFNGDDSLDVIADDQAIDVVNVYFSDPSRSNRYIDPLADFTRLVRNTDGSFTRTFKDGTRFEYNAVGLHTATIDSNGETTAYAYDAQERLTSITDPAGLVTAMTYGANGKLNNIAYPDGRSTSWEYNTSGDLIRYTDVNGDVSRMSYDGAGRVTSQTDPRGNTTTHRYSDAGRYTGSNLPDGSSVSIDVAKTLGLPALGAPAGSYVPADQRNTTVTDANGNVTTTEVNEFGAPIRVTDAIGRVTTMTRNADNLVTQVRRPAEAVPATFALAAGVVVINERVDLMQYDLRGNITRLREAVGTDLERSTFYEYEPTYNKVTKITDPAGFQTLYEYDAFGNQTKMTDAAGGVRNYTYDSRGLMLTGTDENGNLTKYDYDPSGRVIFITDASNTLTFMEYDGAGNVIRETDDFNGTSPRITQYAYDQKNRMTSITDGEGFVTQYTYDGSNNLISITDPTGVVETSAYDSRNRLSSMTDPATGASSYVYDGNDNLISHTDALAQVTTFTYDAVNRLTSSLDPLSQQRSFAYDLRDNITAVTDARGSVTGFDYDILDRPASRTNPQGEVWSFAFDRRDNRITSTKPDGVVVTGAYDALSRLTSLTGGAAVTGPMIGKGAISRSYAYDPVSNLVGANDNLDGVAGAELAFVYDGENRVARQETRNLFGAGALNAALDYAYDPLDRRASMTDSFGGVISYGYDKRDLLSSVTTPSGDLFETTYDNAGRMLGRTAPNVTSMAKAYEPTTGRLASAVSSAGANIFNDHAYSYTARGNIASVAEAGQIARTRNYTYDQLERLTNVAAPGRPSDDENYTLDPEGNRTASHLSASHVTDPANRLLEDDSYRYIYDPSGNLIAKTAKVAGLSSWSYAYDALDQLIAVSRDGAVVEEYRYDALGRRTLISTAGANDIAIINDGPDRFLDLANGGTGAVISKRYTHGELIDEPLQMEAFDGAGILSGRYTYHTDHLGSVRFLTDQAGAIINEYDYDSYGNKLASVETVSQPFNFTGREFDNATGLYDYRARSYDPTTGRFLQEDPIWFEAGDLNVYRYVWNNPLGWIDPTGLVAAERAQTNKVGAGSAGGLAAIGSRLACTFFAIADGFRVLNEAQGQPNAELAFVAVDLADCAATGGVRSLGRKAGKKIGKRCPGRGPGRFMPPVLPGFMSFPKGTLIWVEDGLEPIEEIEVGDLVWSRDHLTGENKLNPVTELFNRTTVEMSVLTVKTEEPGREDDLLVLASANAHVALTRQIRLTPEHPVYVADRLGEAIGWTQAGLLASGDLVADIDGGDFVKIVSNQLEQTEETVYNFEVAGAHSYFADELGLWVHNGRGAAWRKIFYDPRTPKWLKGWIKNELRRLGGNKFSRVRSPRGCDLGHAFGKPAKDGHKHGRNSRWEWSRDNRGRGGRFRL